MADRQRHLLTTHLDAIAQRTGLEPGKVDTHKHEWALIGSPVYPEWQPGYWLEYDYVLTGLTTINTWGGSGSSRPGGFPPTIAASSPTPSDARFPQS